jgi:Ca2+-binding EF-hand superfamily protein
MLAPKNLSSRQQQPNTSFLQSNNEKRLFGETTTIGPNELKELRRVFNSLCFFSEKNPKNLKLRSLRKLLAEKKNSEQQQGKERIGTKVTDVTVSSAEAQQNGDEEKEEVDLKMEESQLENDLHALQSRPDPIIRAQDVAAALKNLGKPCTKREVLDMLWEVDEKLDGVIDWEEFVLMFERNIRDRTGLEPARFYHMVQFMIYDRDENGLVSLDETMHMLYARIGREKMESTITRLFGGDDGAPIVEQGSHGGEINFTRYWDVVDREQRKMFDESQLGRIIAEKRNRKIDVGKKLKRGT